MLPSVKRCSRLQGLPQEDGLPQDSVEPGGTWKELWEREAEWLTFQGGFTSGDL